MNNDRACFLWCTDERFLFPTTVSVCSLLSHLLKDRLAHVRILTDDLPAELVKQFLRTLDRAGFNVDAQVVHVQEKQLGNVPVNGRYPPPVYFRLLAPYLLRDEFDRIIYFDGDTVITGDVTPLVEMDLRGRPFGAAQDLNWKNIRDRLEFLSYLPSLSAWDHVDPDDLYFNSGVMVIDVKKWNERMLLERSLERLHRFADQCPLPDQDGLVGVVQGDWKSIPGRWNFQVAAKGFLRVHHPGVDFADRYGMDYETGLREAVVVHFTGSRPWDGIWLPTLRSPYSPERRFAQALWRSGWFTPSKTSLIVLMYLLKGCVRKAKAYRHFRRVCRK